MTTDKFITILAWTSFIVAFFPALLNIGGIVYWAFFEKKTGKVSIPIRVPIWIALFVWPIVYCFVG